MTNFFHGALFASCLVAALFFWRYWLATRDRLFICFAVTFLLLGVQWGLSGLVGVSNGPEIYLLRLFAFLVLIGGILDKNRRARRP